MLISEVIQYLKDLGFEETPCRIPKNEYQVLKRNLYSYLLGKYPKIYNFLSKISPIKFRKIRADWSLWFKIDGGELELKPIKGQSNIVGGSYGYENYYGNVDTYDYKIQSSNIPYLEQVKDMKDWQIRYISSESYRSFGRVIPFGIDTDDKPDDVNFWYFFPPIEHIEKNLIVYPELQSPIKTYRRNKKLEELI
jgi:hypothetical protein